MEDISEKQASSEKYDNNYIINEEEEEEQNENLDIPVSQLENDETITNIGK